MKNTLKPVVIILSIFLVQSCKKDIVPTITTSAIINITGNSATCGGTLTHEGSGTIVERGICWSKGITPTIADSKTIEGGGPGTFVSNLTNLDGATTYYVRAYAKNAAGIGYGMAMSFTTLGSAPLVTALPATNITGTTTTLNGSVNANYLSTTVTFEYGTTTSYGNTATASQSPVTGNTITNVSADVYGLIAGTTYHFRVKAENSSGITYSEDMSFTTLGQAPTVQTGLACKCKLLISDCYF